MGVCCQELAWHASPPSHGRSAIGLQKNLLSLFRLGLTCSPIGHSGPSFGSGFSKCLHFLVTQTLVAVCFFPYTLQSSDHELLADPRLVSCPCLPINSHLDHCAGSGVRAPLPFSEPHSAAWLSVLKALVCLFVLVPNGLPVMGRSQNQVGTLRPQTLQVQGWATLAAASVSPSSAQVCAQHSSIIFVSQMVHSRSQWPAQS